MKKILIAEDDTFLARAYEMRLKKSNFEVKIALNGEEVFKILPVFLPDLILLDLIMPVKDGYEVLKELKASPEWKDIPVIISSCLSQDDDIDVAKKYGANDYYIKADLDLRDLITKINLLIGK
ncbi:MAG: response regulator [bacterium]|nr:response regulator [bacterium]